MTSVVAASSGTAARRPRTVPLSIVLLMPVGPAAVALLRYLLPYYTDGTSLAMARSASASTSAESAVLWLGYVAVLTLVPGVIALAQLTRPTSPLLTAWGLGLTVPAYLSLGGLLNSDHLLWSAQAAGVDPTTTASLLDHAHPTVGISLGVFVLGHVVGTVLLGLALMRSGRVPTWAGVGLAISQPLHFIATVIVGSNELDLLAWSLTAVGMAVAARALLGPAQPVAAAPVPLAGLSRG